MITSDLDAELVKSLHAMELPVGARIIPGATWRPDPAGDPASYTTSLPFEIATLTDRAPAECAAALAAVLCPLPWIAAAAPSGAGYLTVTVTAAALACIARRITMAGAACAQSDTLAGTEAVILPWPDLAVASSWQRAWKDQAAAMTGRLAETAGASMISSAGERAGTGAPTTGRTVSPVSAAVSYLGVDVVRYWLARMLPGRIGQLSHPPRPETDRYEAVQRAHAEACATLRWAAELEVERADPADGLATALGSAPERQLLGQLSWLPVRVASAARRHRPSDLPRYLERVAAAWTECRLARPALPFGGMAATRDADVAGARLLLADAVRVVLATGMALTGIEARDQI